MGLLGSLGSVAYDILCNDKTGDGSKKSQANLMAVGAAFTGVGVASKLMVDDVNRSFLDFDEAMTAVEALGGTSEEEFNRMKDAALELSSQVPISATSVADAMYSMISVGYDFDTMMNTIPEATKLAVGGNMELKDSVDAVINVFGAYGEGVYSAADVTNILAKAVGVGKWELGDFTSEIMRNIGAGANLGISFNELAAANVLLQNRFTSAEVAGTSMNAMLTRLVNPSVIQKLEEMGVHVKDNEGNFVGLESVLNQLDDALSSTGGNVDRMSALQEIFGQEGVKAAMALLDEKDKLGELSGQMNDASFKNEAFNTVVESTGSKLEIATNKMDAAKIALGEGMAPATEIAADAMGGLANALKELPEPLQGVAGMALYAAQGFAVLGPALMGLAALKSLGLGAVFAGIAQGLAGLGSTIAGLSGTLVSGLTAAFSSAIVAVGAGVALGLAGVWILLETGVLDWISGIGRLVEQSDLGNMIMRILKVVLAPIGAIGNLIIDIVSGQWDLSVIAEDMAAPFRDAVGIIGETVGGLADGLSSAFSSITSAITSGLGGLPGAVSGILSGIPGTISGIFSGLTSTIGSALSGIPNAIKAAFTGIGGIVSAAVGEAASAITEAFGGVVEGIAEALATVPDVIADAFSGVGDLIGSVFAEIPAIVGDIFSGLSGVIGSALSDVSGTIASAFSGVTSAVESALSGVPGALTSSFGTITSAFSALGGSVQQAFTALFTGISDFIVTMGQGFIAAGYNIIMYIVQGMQSAAGAIASTIGNIFNIIGQFIPHSPAETGPLSQLPNFGAYFVDPLLATVPAVQAASLQVAEAAAAPVAQPASISGGTQIGYQDNSAPIDIGSITASKDYSITDIMAEIATMQAQKRAQRGVTSG
ncbi:phage tail tape measure protein [Methanospirillum stamsii]|uniref:Phage tail tape measure protein n=1 Tax=Methanospirillum stamsii TaxID=1277351 RepID=A0A2V2N8C8_9EURY|nr:phage tail tape measure protein [Methanospirillum stamsii]PWR74805.1 phage tail tape measure protein [Methanospirillum stamsii]